MPEPQIDDLKKAADRIGGLFAKYARAMASSSKWIRGGAVLAGGMLAAASQIALASEEIPPTWAVIAGFLGAVLVLGGGVWALIVDQTAPEALEEARKSLEIAREASARVESYELSQARVAEEHEEICAVYDEHIRWLTTLHSAGSVLRETVEHILARKSPPTHEQLQELLEKEARNLLYLLGFDIEEYWTVAIYGLTSDESGNAVLKCRAHMRSERNDEKREHRSWGKGQGVVGQVALTGRELVVADLADAASNAWHNVPKDLCVDHDGTHYRSFAAVPVRVTNCDPLWGVIIATSDQPSRFEPIRDGTGDSRIEPLRLLAGVVAIAAAPHFKPINEAESHNDS